MNFRGKNKVTPEFNLSSMTDVVFLLLIFFMLASTLISTNVIDVVLPTAAGKAQSDTPITVTIKKDFTYYIEDKRVGLSVLEFEIINQLKKKSTPSFILRAEKSIPIEKVVHIMDIANRNNFKVTLAVKPN